MDYEWGTSGRPDVVVMKSSSAHTSMYQQIICPAEQTALIVRSDLLLRSDLVFYFVVMWVWAYDLRW